MSLRVLVPCKRVLDLGAKVRLNAAKSGIDTQLAKYYPNPLDDIAVAEAVKLKQNKQVESIVAVSCGPKACVEVLRKALAMGADKAIHVVYNETDSAPLQPLAVAKLLQKVAEKEKSNLIIMGKQAADNNACQTGQMLAGLLKWPQATFASKVDIIDGGKTVEVVREIDGGTETITASLPAVVTADLRLNDPPLPSLPNIMKAKKKPLETIESSALDVDTKPRIEIIGMTEPPTRQGCRIVESVDELVAALKKDGHI
ncbi:electron transfer flavoprotein subunit beta-like protein [Syncephalis fuscata]|nr:electron transfer flavoprotein subunit beta-like protein [Syncephalis fuscata]